MVWDDLLSLFGNAGNWLGNAASSAGNWAAQNPMSAAQLGLGAAGTGLGLYEAYTANQEAKRRQKLAESLMAGGAQAQMPTMSPQAMLAMLAPYRAQLQSQGIDLSGGAGRQAFADALSKNYLDRFQLGNMNLQSKLGALGLFQQPQPYGNTGALGQALAFQALQRARQQGQTPSGPVGQVETRNLGFPTQGGTGWSGGSEMFRGGGDSYSYGGPSMSPMPGPQYAEDF